MAKSLASTALLSRLPYGPVIDSVSDLVSVADADGRLVYANAAWRQAAGLPEDADASAPSNTVATFSELALTCGRLAQRAMRGETVRDEDMAVMSGYGRRRFRTTVLPITDEEGQTLGAVTISHEVSAPRPRDGERDLQHLTLQTVFAHSPAGILIVDVPHWTILDHNPAILGMIPAALRQAGPLVGQSVESIVDADTYDGLETIFRQAITQQTPIVVPEFAVSMRVEAEPRFYRGSVTPLRRPDGEVDQLLLIAVEITDEMRVRQQVAMLAETAQARAQELEVVISNIADAVVITDAQSRALQANAAYLRLVGAPKPGETSTERITRFRLRRWDGSEVEPRDMPAMRTIATGQPAVQDLIATREDGREIFLHVSAAPLHNRDGILTGTVIVLSDLTAFEETKREKDAFLSLISHELRTPLTIIRGFTQLVARTLERAQVEETRHRLEVVQRHVDELTWLVNMLLDMTLVESGQLACQLSWIDYRAMLDNLLHDMATLHPGHKFRLHCPDSVWLHGDGDRLRQVVTYLVENALEHGPEGTSVSLTVQEDNGRVVTFVCDEGPPLPVEERDLIFERFYRIRPQPILNGGSLGLGLFIGRAIVEAHGGSMWVSEDSHCSFAFSLPLRPAITQES